MTYPALDVTAGDADLVLAVVDEFHPTAVEETDGGLTIYFLSRDHRDAAQRALATSLTDAVTAPREVDDEDWARRSQQNLTAVTVGRLVVTPPWCDEATHPAPGLQPIVIVPSMGFGTGHHATTRLCLAALQAVACPGASVLDVGTGSGVLALAARVLGATTVLGLDFDPDAIANAQENLEANPAIDGVTFQVADIAQGPLPVAEVVLANLTGATLVQHATALRAAVRPHGVLIVSGLQPHERADVLAALAPFALVDEATELDWCCLTLRPRD